MTSIPITSIDEDNNERCTTFRSCLIHQPGPAWHTHQHRNSDPADCFSQLNDDEGKTLSTSSKRARKSKSKSKSNTRSNQTSSWDIGSIESLPDSASIFPLEKTRVSVDNNDNESPNEIGQRICDSLRDLSISVVSKRRNKLLAESLDCDVRFYIKLYKEKTPQTNSSSGYRVMVEIQKRRGCSLSFGKIARTILQAAKSGYSANKEEASKMEQPLFRRLSNQTIAVTEELYKNTEEQNDVSFSCDLKRTADLIRNERMDSSLHGMQDLAILTNVDITDRATARRVSRLVLRDGNTDVEDSADDLGLDSLIRSFICCDTPNNGNDHHIQEDGFEQWHFSKMRYYALSILANSLHVILSSSSNGEGLSYLQSIICTESWLGTKSEDGLLSMLTDELTNTDKHPHHAYQAMRCMSIIFQVSPPPEVCMKVVELGVCSAIRTSRTIGRDCHSGLAHESDIAFEASMSALRERRAVGCTT